VHSSGDTIEDVESTLNNQGGCISKWYQENLLKCNQEKFQVMRLGPRYKKKEMNIDIMDISINSSLAINLLGVSIDDEQNFSNHMCHL
jgi:aryl carrier-like protein